MNQSAKDFLSQWSARNIHNESYVRVDEPDPRLAEFATRCRADAAAAGLTEQDLVIAARDLHGAASLEACMATEIDVCAQRHLADLASQRS